MGNFGADSMTIDDLPKSFGDFEEQEEFGEGVPPGYTPTSLKTKVTKYVTETIHYPHIELDLLDGVDGLELRNLEGMITQQNLPGFNLFLKIPEGMFDIGILPKVSIQTFLEKFGEDRVSYHSDGKKVYKGRMITALNP